MALDARTGGKILSGGDTGAEYHLWGVGTDVIIPRQPNWRLQSAAFWIGGHGEYPIWVGSALARVQGKIVRATEQIEWGSRPHEGLC